MLQDSITPLSLTVTAMIEISVAAFPSASADASATLKLAATERPVFKELLSVSAVSSFTVSFFGFSTATGTPVQPESIPTLIANVKSIAIVFFMFFYLHRLFSYFVKICYFFNKRIQKKTSFPPDSFRIIP